jgi:hypothetical protein
VNSPFANMPEFAKASEYTPGEIMVRANFSRLQI